ncbi:MAG: lipoyl synthase [Deltaproteobacteria bacterium]|jgi:lipoic acid synthetase|nr:lipoyl synthase [Deltaproteobacteria bacterium]MDX9761805.1 lipoyl synthase [Desulfomonilia bacterium]
MKDRGRARPCQERIPSWAKKNKRLKELHLTKTGLRASGLASVCEEARCPNIAECFARPTAAFLILGHICTRGCRFCSIRKGAPAPPDPCEGERVAQAAAAMGLKHVVITSVTRDDLPDQGAGAFACTIREIRKLLPEATVEVLIPDFSGRADLIETVLRERPEVFNHNIETVDRLYGSARPQASLRTSLAVLRTAREFPGDTVVKSGFMLGLGESEEEVAELLEALSRSGCEVVTMGQYLQPTAAQVPVSRYWSPEDFKRFSDIAKNTGIRYVISGPLVRSSYQAKLVLEEVRRDRISVGMDGTSPQKGRD